METSVAHEPIVLMEDEKTHRKMAIIDIEEVANDPELLEELVDIILAQADKDDEVIPWEVARKELMLKGLIDESL